MISELGTRDRQRTVVQFFVHLSVIFLCVGYGTPGINESHYLPKAKHAWDASFAPGDLFLESHDSHLVATSVAGMLTTILPLSAVAWFGRLLSWSLFAWAWIHLCRAIRIPKILTPLALASWFFAIQYGHWAGEWAIGGFEAKAIAYPLVLMGLADCLRQRWSLVWLWLGAAIAWHPIVGGWAGLSIGLFWCVTSWRNKSFTTQLARLWPWMLAGAAIGLLGVLPALAGLGGPNQIGKLVASQIHVYYRLAHHLCPRMFAPDRHLAAAFSILALCTCSVMWCRLLPRIKAKKQLEASDGDEAKMAYRVGEPAAALLAIAWISVGISIGGLALDLGLATYQPKLASQLLRFYWFRWSDVAVPLAWTLTLWRLIGIYAFVKNSGQSRSRAIQLRYGRLALGAGTVVVTVCLYRNFEENWETAIPPADRLVVEATGPHEVSTENRYVDWLAVCRWIRENTPTDSLWLTPKYQQTFKWHAGRAEVVCWKDVPQNNAAVLEWYQRLEACEPPRTEDGKLEEWSTEDLKRLHRQFGFGWVLVDRTVQQDPPRLEIAYPINVENRSFAVFRLGDR